MLLSYMEDFLARMEADETIHDRATAIRRLREIGWNDFAAILWSMPHARYPRVSSLLPAMASVEVQRAWTGTDGDPLLAQSMSFMRSVYTNYAALTGETPVGKRILDFGCGYGRMTRLCYFLSDDVWCVDPWDEALRLCREAGLTRNLYQSDELPITLPVPEDFDLIISLSVLTHTSERATKVILKALRKHLRPGGVACVTIRPIEYWIACYSRSDSEDVHPVIAEMNRQHTSSGFAFTPHCREPVDGDITFGDTSMSTEWLAMNLPEWSIVATDRSIDDPVQRYLFLQARAGTMS